MRVVFSWELTGKKLMGRLVLRGYQYAAGILVQSMNDTRAKVLFRGIDFPVVQKTVNKSPRIVPRRRMYNQALGFVYHDNPVILVEDLQGNLLRHQVDFRRGLQSQPDPVSRSDPAGQFNRLFVDIQLTDPLFQLIAAYQSQFIANKLVDPQGALVIPEDTEIVVYHELLFQAAEDKIQQSYPQGKGPGAY